VIDSTNEALIGLDEAARLKPPSRSGKRTHASTILRWILNGSRAPDGERVRLEGLRLGGKWVTSREAIQRFAERLTPNLSTTVVSVRSASRRQQGSERAAKALTKIGI